MAKATTRKLKVFQARFGFHDSVVAATSQAAALRAWGTHQNLFADGQASLATDGAAIEAALAQPDVPLRRALGSEGAFAVQPSELPTVPDLPKLVVPRSQPQPKPQPRPAPDRGALDAAERALATLDADRKREEAELKARQADLDAAVLATRTAYVERRKAAKAAVTTAREAYRNAGGGD
ncbi:hypothetical protein P7D22_19150 [Lichenihabitans sp. Uapishka_5]|uniref:hypothetical protein n=1 Tax=Lichenihabitans sp. Uapishka_5 TaxID=3037302 RepID=UPI0029E81E98|nr:hypothetical protein [Lichenihabitans sp. Uapishka_5]MDX7953284.1 hypothetical protein [Lichenihabitans sp. Uapishka_5]